MFFNFIVFSWQMSLSHAPRRNGGDLFKIAAVDSAVAFESGRRQFILALAKDAR